MTVGVPSVLVFMAAVTALSKDRLGDIHAVCTIA